MNLKRLFVLLVSTGLLSACGVTHVHEMGNIPHDKAAFIEGVPGYNPLSVVTVQVYSIDGKAVSRRNNVFEVEAGEHRVEVICRREQPEFVQRKFSFQLIMKPGQRFRPRLDMTRDCHVDYIEKSTGRVFSGTES